MCERRGLVVDCSACGATVHYVAGLGVTPGNWAHREPMHAQVEF